MVRTIIGKTKKEGQKKGQKTNDSQELKKREKISPSHGMKLFHPRPF